MTPAAASTAQAPLASEMRAFVRASPRYDEVQQKSVHNAYEQDEPLFDQLVWDRVRSVELDVHEGRRGAPTLDRDFYVYHVDAPGLGRTSCAKLSDCLGEIRAWHDAFPAHEVVTLMVDLKDAVAGDALDARLLAHLGRASIVSPADVVAACPGARDLQEAVRKKCGWPRLDALRGKFLIAVTGGTACDKGSNVSRYGGDGARLAFVAPNATETCDVGAYLARAPWVGFVNADFANLAQARAARAAGLVARVYGGGIVGGLDDERSWNAAKDARVNLLATDKVNFAVDPWAATHDARGFPFTCLGACPAALGEDLPAMTVSVESSDLFGEADGFLFASTDAAVGRSSWTTSVSVASSHTDRLGKACLMARADDTPGAAYFAVCRTADGGPLRVQWRDEDGAATRAIDAGANGAFLRLDVTPRGNATDVDAYGSRDGVSWARLRQETLGARLVHQGIAASSHGSGPMRFVFGALQRDQRRVSSADLRAERVGDCASGAVSD